MSYKFPSDIQDRVDARMDGGTYQSEDDVLRQAMDALDQAELEKLTRWNVRNQLACQQSDQNLAKPLDDQQVLGRLRERLAQEGILG